MINIKLLTITRNAWSNNIGTGNTFSNFFSGWKGDVANVYCRDEKINNKICKKYFQITESQLINNILRRTDVGVKREYSDFQEMQEDDVDLLKIQKEEKKYSFFRNHRWVILLWIRELIWKLGKWKTNEFENFLKKFSPDLIIMPIHDCFYMYDILFYAMKITNAKIILITGDDMYSLKQFSLSPLYWINKFFLRAKIRKAVELSDFRFCLTDMQSEEYSKIFSVPFYTYMKGIELKDIVVKEKFEIPLQMIYTGNIFPGRYKTLDLIGQAMEKINKNEIKIEFKVYSGNKPTKDMEKAFDYKGVEFCGSVSSDEVKKIQENADIVVHAEDFSLINKLKVRLSFSTKIVDYLSNAKCIFAVGPGDVASIDYLIRNDAAVVANNKGQIEEKLKLLVDNHKLIAEYGRKAWDCGKRNHRIEDIQNRLYKDFEEILNESSSN